MSSDPDDPSSPQGLLRYYLASLNENEKRYTNCLRNLHLLEKSLVTDDTAELMAQERMALAEIERKLMTFSRLYNAQLQKPGINAFRY